MKRSKGKKQMEKLEWKAWAAFTRRTIDEPSIIYGTEEPHALNLSKTFIVPVIIKPIGGKGRGK